MKLIYQGKFSGDPDSIPHGEHQPGAVAFREFQTVKALAIFANVLAVVLAIPLVALYIWRLGRMEWSLLGALLALLCLFPHELLHGVCFRKEVYLYTNWKQGMLFVTGPETMSRRRFVMLSLLPNLVFGVVPFLLFLCRPQWIFLGTLGMLAIPMGVGDYCNVFNALTQMPKGARTYLHGFHSYWYLPGEDGTEPS